jgi:hypothetical protein
MTRHLDNNKRLNIMVHRKLKAIVTEQDQQKCLFLILGILFLDLPLFSLHASLSL